LVGTLHESIILPILLNIYFTELDKFVGKKTLSGRESKNLSPSPYFHCFTKIDAGYRLRNNGFTLITAGAGKTMTNIQHKNRLLFKNEGLGCRVYYLRYAGVFLIGIRGPQVEARGLLQQVEGFCARELRLFLGPENLKVTCAKTGKAVFLGAEIFRPGHPRTQKQQEVENKISLKWNCKAKIYSSRLTFYIPIRKIVEKLHEQQFCEIQNYARGKIKPKGQMQ
jgi:hypothetical protein